METDAGRKFSNLRMPRFAICLAVAATAAGLALAAATGGDESISRRESNVSSPARVLNVEVTEAQQVSGYNEELSLIGRIEAARRSELGFELAGLVSRVFVEEGDFVERGAPVAELDTARLRARRKELEARLEEERAALALAQKTRARTKDALKLNAVSKQQWDEADQSYRARGAAVRRVRAQIETVGVDIGKSVLPAPFSGTIAKRMADEGDVVSAGEPVARLLETGRLEIRVGVGNHMVQTLTKGDELPVHAAGVEFRAIVRDVLPERGRRTRTVGVILTVPRGVGELREGDLAQVWLSLRVEETGFWLPLTALTESSRGLWACYAVETPTGVPGEASGPWRLDRRQLELIYHDEHRAFVRGTLSDGELVVASGVHRLVQGQRVRVAPESSWVASVEAGGEETEP